MHAVGWERKANGDRCRPYYLLLGGVFRRDVGGSGVACFRGPVGGCADRHMHGVQVGPTRGVCETGAADAHTVCREQVEAVARELRLHEVLRRVCHRLRRLTAQRQRLVPVNSPVGRHAQSRLDLASVDHSQVEAGHGVRLQVAILSAQKFSEGNAKSECELVCSKGKRAEVHNFKLAVCVGKCRAKTHSKTKENCSVQVHGINSSSRNHADDSIHRVANPVLHVY